MSASHILVVDDDVITCHALKEYFEQRGHRVTLADGCQEAGVVLGGSLKVDLMILDYLMPDGHGTDLIRSLAENDLLQKPTIVMCSSLIDPNNPAWKALCNRIPFGLQSLIRAYISKPYTLKEIDPLISEILVGDYKDSTIKEKSPLPTLQNPSR